MNRVFEYQIENEWGSIEKFLIHKKWPQSVIKVLKRNNELLRLNNETVSTKHPLKEKDILNVTVENQQNEDIQPIAYPLMIVYEDEDIIVLNKPYGMPVHPSKKQHDVTLANAIVAHLGSKDTFHCPTRLDRDTSGLVIIAKNKVAASVLSEEAFLHQIEKEYLAIVEGKIEETQTINAPIDRIGDTMIREVNFETGKEAITELYPLKYYPEQNVTLIRLVLQTGRTHQIRVHTKYIGHPIVGDQFYNRENQQMNRQALMANKITFIHPTTFEKVSFTVDMDDDFKELLKEGAVTKPKYL